MKIVLLSGWYFPDSVGGTETYVDVLAKDLQTLGHTVVVAAPSRNAKEYSYIHNDIEIYRYPISLNPTRAEIRGETAPEYFEVFCNWLQAQKADVVHQHTFNRGCGFFHAQFVKQCNIPFVFTAHVPDIVCVRGTLMRWGHIPCDGKFIEERCAACSMHRRGLNRFSASIISHIPKSITAPFEVIQSRYATPFQIKHLVANRQENLLTMLNSADYVVAVAQWLGEMLIMNGLQPHKLIVSRHGLPPDFDSQNNRVGSVQAKSPLRVAYIGRFDPVKGVHILIEAAKHLNENALFELYLYGKTNNDLERDYLNHLQELANNTPNIIFGGQVTPENRSQIMENIDLLAVPSVGFETGPFVVLEAFAYGIPVIGSDLGGIAEVVTNEIDGILVPPGDVLAWRKKFEELANNPRIIQELAENISSIRKSLDVALEMQDIYQNIKTIGVG